MKAIILAAGMGTRLGNMVPKPLTAIDQEKSILDFQVERICKEIDINDIIVVVGYEYQKIMESHQNLTYVLNHDYATTGTAKSLLKALIKVKDEDVLWMNGDVYFDEDVLNLLINSNSSCCLVDNKKCGDEEVKYILNEQGLINEISKEVINPKGEAVGINLIKAEDLESFKEKLRVVGNEDYFEKAIENLIKDQTIGIRPAYLGELFCKEIDFQEDLAEVIEYINLKDKI